MFSNIGTKIKGLATVVTWLGIIASLCIGSSWMKLEEDMAMVIGIIIIVAGSLLSWLMSFVLYGFGQLVDNSDKLVMMNEQYMVEELELFRAKAQKPEDKLAELEKLKAEGLITEEEYLNKIGNL